MVDAGRMAWRRIALLALVVGLAGCGALPDPPPPRPAPAPEVRGTERQGELKAATFRAAAAAEAARLARLRAAIRKARASETVGGALRLALLTGHISPATHARLTREYTDARWAVSRLTGTRAYELGTVLASVDSLAARHLLSPGRLRPAFLILHRNTQFWTHAPFPAAAQRTTFGRDPAVFQYYPGNGMQLQPLASWARPTGWPASAGRTAPAAAAAPAARSPSCAARSTGCSTSPPPRGDFLAWEYYFSWGGGTPPWISGMTQATAVSALARASRALDVPRWRRAAHRALGSFTTPPPLGVDGGDHFLMYSFSPTLRVFNGELQAVSGIGQFAGLYPQDRLAGRLFRRGERTARGMIPASDTGTWSLYSSRRTRGDARLPPADRRLLRRHVPRDAAPRPTAPRTIASRATSASRRGSRSPRCAGSARTARRPCASRSRRSRRSPCRYSTPTAWS